jgi:hypothetical protein
MYQPTEVKHPHGPLPRCSHRYRLLGQVTDCCTHLTANWSGTSPRRVCRPALAMYLNRTTHPKCVASTASASPRTSIDRYRTDRGEAGARSVTNLRKLHFLPLRPSKPSARLVAVGSEGSLRTYHGGGSGAGQWTATRELVSRLNLAGG